jgi:hypothetical protein
MLFLQGSGGYGGPYFLLKNTTMNGEGYKNIIRDHLILFLGL